ncbi:hypothetical protein LTR56_014649 [Elasticomyces elasticus]|nr:hypothetical protein LTR56_014649 [Elasticomyces elasticus]KAK3645326.1 hypothetical protein LTR22_014791 [Elasticomyces elasticus]KAK4919833.1 hypothetical protein LTR49_012580 [Elasticomyces elasticus]KAK5750097.1 hypothetical protein LTS12_019823 [Elasticomyces elasticus]
MRDVEAAVPVIFTRNGMTPPTDGYPAVASFISSDPDSESFVFRKFNTLTARKLLHAQAELLDLEHRLAEFDAQAAAGYDHELHLSAREWERLTANAKVRSQEKDRMELMDEIEVKLEKYHQALLLQEQVARLERPPRRVLRAYREALLGRPGEYPKLGGRAEHMLDDEEDLVMLSPPLHNDILSRFLRRYWLFGTKPATDHASRTRYFEEQSLIWLVNVCSTAIAATLLIGSILALYFVTSPDARLGIVLGFIVLFAVGLSVSTSASRDAVFAATAAYSAVLIVYISGSGISGANGGFSPNSSNCSSVA